MNFLLDLLVFKGLLVDVGHVIGHHLFVIFGVGFFNVTLLSWDGQSDLFRLDTSFEKTLNASVSVETSAVDHTVLHSLFVSQDVYKSSVSTQVLIEIWIVNAQDSIISLKTFWKRRNTS